MSSKFLCILAWYYFSLAQNNNIFIQSKVASYYSSMVPLRYYSMVISILIKDLLLENCCW
jgi:hypothetical protein